MSVKVGDGVHRALGLTDEEYLRIVDILGREPNFNELTVFSVMWSEHCSYKNSLVWLRKLPRESEKLLAVPGEENAGIIDIGYGLGCAFKIESHNHPCAIEPYQGAATGVGGIHRDIFTTGAIPVAQLNSLHFGEIDYEKTPFYVKQVVKGIADYGNSFGVPNIGGETYFAGCYNRNPIINAMSCGILDRDRFIRARTKYEGQVVVLIGSLTGPDGIHGATFASGVLTDASEKELPSVQIGDPFMEKILLEAIIEMNEKGLIEGMQDLGAGGISCASSEMSSRGGHGMDIYLDRVPLRLPAMKPYEIMVSESQERMMLVTSREKISDIERIARKWGIFMGVIGEVTSTRRVRFFYEGEVVADIPSDALVAGKGAPIYTRKYEEPPSFKERKNFNINFIKDIEPSKKIFLDMLRRGNTSSKRFIYEQYDRLVGTINITHEGFSDAGVVAVRGTPLALAFSTDCNPYYVEADPYGGSMRAVMESAINVACCGAYPVAITNCLNFGNPYDPYVFWSFVKTIEGIRDACNMLGIPVTGGNVSFYNEYVSGDTNNKTSFEDDEKGGFYSTTPVMPTPVIGMMGIIDDRSKVIPSHFVAEDSVIILLGEPVNDISCSEYLRMIKGDILTPLPHSDFHKALTMIKLLNKMVGEGIILCSHDVSEGGLWVCLTEMSLHSKFSMEVSVEYDIRHDAFWFGESFPRVVVCSSRENASRVINLAEKNKIPAISIGRVITGDKIIVNGVEIDKREMLEAYFGYLPSLLNL